LIVDDEAGVRSSLRWLLADEHRVSEAESVDRALAMLGADSVDLVLLDLVLPGKSGLELLRDLGARDDAPPVVMITATRSLETAVQAMREGAIDYVTKPFDAAELRIKVKRVLERGALEREVVALRARVDASDAPAGLLGTSPAMREVFRAIRRIAPSRARVLIRGESGTGKELVARALHELSPRAPGPLIEVNCAAIPESLIESELFGHERGAFTDAVERRVGKFEAASGGTLFLDEIGELALSVQPKLLRALQEQKIERVGGSGPIPVDVRVIAATHRNLAQAVAKGRFRSDLYYRIDVVQIDLPPLRDRIEDIALLAAHFLERHAAENEVPVRRLPTSARRALERYPWPGNVRELENAMARAAVLCEGREIRLEDLPDALRQEAQIESLRDALRAGTLPLDQALARFERELLLETLAACGWNQTHSARRLGITRRSLKLRMDRLGLGSAVASPDRKPDPSHVFQSEHLSN
jgi:DNA-binding NtrC family response regulator